MTDDQLQEHAWKTCCNFHHDPEDIRRHLERGRLEYGKTTGGAEILPPLGWKILPYRTVVPPVHREFYEDYGWLAPRRMCSTVTPLFAKPHGRTRCYAVPVPDATQPRPGSRPPR